jgi:glycolate oxidase iron-sulfur subunit
MDDQSEISRCNRCGFCQSVCPTYLATRDEAQVARGRIYLVRMLREGRYDPARDADLAERVGECLLCRACVEGCPASVKTDEIMMAARRDFLKARGLGLFHRLVYRGALGRRERLERVASLMRLYGRSGAGHLVRVLGKALGRLSYYDSFLPPGMERPARTRLPAVVRPAATPRMKVVYFLGCASNVFAAKTAISAVAYLAARGAEVLVPQVRCCGEPQRSAGDEVRARALAAWNAEAVFGAGADFITTDCSTCASSLAGYGGRLPEGPLADLARAGAGKVVDLNTLVVESLGLATDGLRPCGPASACYHDPCHAIRGLGVKKAPRAVLSAIPDLELREMEGAAACCGGAGSYGFTHPKMSAALASGKVESVARTRAEILATSCPACALQLGAGLRRAGRSTPVAHPVELLARAARTPGLPG